jgi:hypothetical protein
MTPAWLTDAIENNYDGHSGRAQYLPCCWIPRHSFERWLVKHRLPKDPPRFEPRETSPKTRDPAIGNDEDSVDRAAIEKVHTDYDERAAPVIVIRPVRKDARPSAAREPSPGGIRKGSPSLERARQALSQIHPDGVPSQAIVPNAILCGRVGAWLKDEKLPGDSDSTILRAAGRRK